MTVAPDGRIDRNDNESRDCPNDTVNPNGEFVGISREA